MTDLPGTQAVICLQIVQERIKQDRKWGEQRHPSVPLEENVGFVIGLIGSNDAKESCDAAAKAGQLTWAHIAVEELSEAVDANDDIERRVELIQLLAVVMAWVECIDRRRENG